MNIMSSETLPITNDLLASKTKRFWGYLIDYVLAFLFLAFFGVIAGLLSRIGYDGMYLWITSMNPIGEICFNLSITLLYYIFFEGIAQLTLGKIITGTKVVMEDGSRPETGPIVLRTLCRLIPFEAFSFLGENSRGWHDGLSNTYVIDVKKYKEALALKNSFEEIGKENL
jgi:uncharacterized RDD family membrane protein YckC